MTQPGFGYDTPEGYPTQPPFPSLQYPAYAQPSQPANERANIPGQQHSVMAQQSYEYNRNMIPGLGLGFAPTGTAQQVPWGRSQPGNGYSAPQPPQSSSRSLNQVALKTGDRTRPKTMAASGSASDEESEEGEVSEDEIEDLYEPPDIDGDGTTVEGTGDVAMESRDTLMTGVASRPQAAGPGAGWRKGHPGQSSTGRERSGSYSPYLSPREIDHVEPAHASAYQDSYAPPNKRTVSTTSPYQASKPTGLTAPAAVQSVASARQQAREAILRLWPLNVRYQNYLQEGVDGAILGGLFKDLGLDIPASGNVLEKPKPTGSTGAELPAKRESAVPSRSKAQPAASEPATAEPARSLDKSEERKDRIARLLAAKGSKPGNKTAVVPSTTNSTAASTAAAADAKEISAIKKQSEKSRLLQQKMEALLKAREALTQSRSQLAAHADADAANSDIDNMPMSDFAAASTNPDEGLSGPSDLSNKAAVPVDRSGQPSPSSIPGLFLSSTPQPSQVVTRKHHVAAIIDNQPAKHPRPHFGQIMESRPFLIHVSDDEDDAEMDIDSSGDPASPVNHAETRFQKPGVPRDSVSASNNGMPRAVPSPSVSTTPKNSGHNSGGEDLESMNKKIEAMKRKIAEAEARKKAKRSRQVSPAASQPNGSSCDDSAEVSISHAVIAPVLSMSAGLTPANDTPIQTVPISSPQERTARPVRVDQGPGYDRRSRSRAASERLPLIEARRKEQLLRLQSLQSLIQNIERDIEESMLEEERLKRDLVTSSSDQDQSPSNSEPSSVEGQLTFQAAEESAQSDAMDTTSGSSAASEEPGNSNGDAARQGLERVGSATADRAGHLRDSKYSGSGLGDASHTTPAAGDPERVDKEGMLSMQAQFYEPAPVGEVEDDVIMGEADESAGDGMEAGSDDYEPPDAESSAVEDVSPSPPKPAPVAEHIVQPQPSSHAEPNVSVAEPVAQQISAGHAGFSPEPGREVETVPLTQHVSGPLTSKQVGPAGQSSTSDTSQSHFVPYDTPLQYFRAYRFHPQFNESVAGGLRSLTYSNKIDVRKEICPDELAGQPCPRGSQCEYQHFENMKTADDQILLQLGAAGNYDNEKKQEYISGLRQLLTEYRNRKVKDFNTISQGIIEYRAQFQGDRSKILPLGSVSI